MAISYIKEDRDRNAFQRKFENLKTDLANGLPPPIERNTILNSGTSAAE